MTSPTPRHPNTKQARMREKAEEINLVLLAPDVDLWKLRELALSEGGLVNGKMSLRLPVASSYCPFCLQLLLSNLVDDRHPSASSLAQAGRFD
jgi:hypothetical protein